MSRSQPASASFPRSLPHPESRSGSPAPSTDVQAAGDASPLSKTRRKAQSHALQALGKQLVDLPEGKLDAIALPDQLRSAILAARSINAREGRRRQLQFIGKLMRSADAERIADALTLDGLTHRREVAAMHAAESWRDGLLDGSRTLTTFIERHPGGATRPLAQLLSQARRERDSGATPRNARTLYRELLATIEERRTDANADAK